MLTTTTELSVRLASLRIWIQTQWYERVNVLPNLDELDQYIRITTNGTNLPFKESTQELEANEFLFVIRNGEMQNGTVYRIARTSKNILRYTHLDLTKYWINYTDPTTYDRNYLSQNQVRLTEIAMNDTLANVVDDAKFMSSLITATTVLGGLDTTTMRLYEKATLRLQLRQAQLAIRNEDERILRSIELHYDRSQLIQKLIECPWFSERQAVNLLNGLRRLDGSVVAHASISACDPTIASAVMYDENRIFMITPNSLYEILESSPFEPRVYNLH